MTGVSNAFIPNIPRPNEHERLVAFLLDQRFFLPVAISTSLPGARGFGKTSLARSICQDPRVKEAFAEGILWVTLGYGLSPLEIISRIEQLLFDLTGERKALEDIPAAEAQLHEMLHPRRTLLVIDEADNEEALKPFLQSGPGGACLLISHNDEHLPIGTRRISVDIMMPGEATALLAAGLPAMESASPEPPAAAQAQPAESPEGKPPGEESAEERRLPAAPASQEGISESLNAGKEDGPLQLAEDAAEYAASAVSGSEDFSADALPEMPPPDLGDHSSNGSDRRQVAPVDGSVLVESAVLAQIEKEARVASAPSPEAAGLLESLADRLNEWPLLLSLVNGLMRGCCKEDEPGSLLLIDVLKFAHATLDQQGVYTGWRIVDGPARQRVLASVIVACLEPMDVLAREHYLDLAVFPAGEDVPMAAASVLWSMSIEDTRADFEQLARRALIDIDLDRDTFQINFALHDCLLDQLHAGQLVGLHHRLLDAYQSQCPSGWASGPDDGYYFQHLAGHFIAAGRPAELQSLLFNFDWLSRFLQCVSCAGGRRADMYSLLGDYERALSMGLDNQSAQLRLVQDALRLSAPALMQDPAQLAPQLLGRLLPFKEAEIHGLVSKASAWHAGSWLRPLAACFAPPGGDEVRLLSGHTDWVTGITILPDGQHAVSSSLDGTLRVWDLANGQTQNIIVVTQNEEEVSEIVSVVTGKPRGTGPLNLNTGQLLAPRHEHPGGVSAVVITPDGQKAVTAGWDGFVRIWNLVTGHEERSIQAHIEAIGALAITPDGKRIITGADDRQIRVWDLASGEQQFELTGHADLVRSLAVTPDGRTLISGSWDYSLRVWDLESGALMQLFPGHDGWVQCLTVTPNGDSVISSSWDRTVRIWDLYTGETIRELSGFSSPILSMIVTPDNRSIIMGAGDGTISIWNLESGERLRKLAGHSGGVNCLALTRGGRFAVSSSDDRTIRVWDLVSIQNLDLQPGHAGPVHALAALPGSERAVTASWDGTLKIWDPSLGREVCTLDAHSGGVVALALAGDGRRAISGSRDQTLRLWDILSGEELLLLSGHEHPITAVAITPDASLAASGDDGGVVRVWNLSNGACLAEFRGENSIWACALTPDGKTVMASESSGKMYFLAVEK